MLKMLKTHALIKLTILLFSIFNSNTRHSLLILQENIPNHYVFERDFKILINSEFNSRPYVNQLVEMLQEAHGNLPAPRYFELPEEMECLRDVIDLEMSMEKGEEYTMESIFGVPKIYFPPENRLSDEQIRQLIRGILELWNVFHYEAVFRKGEFTEREQYTKLVNQWEKSHPVLRGTSGTWFIELFDYDLNWDEDEGRYLSDEEYYAKHPLPKLEDFEFDEEDN